MIIPNIWENKTWQPNHQPDKSNPQFYHKCFAFPSGKLTLCELENHHLFFRQINYQWAIFYSYVKLPAGTNIINYG